MHPPCIAAARLPLPEVMGFMVAMRLTVIHELVQIICRQGTHTLAYCVHPPVYAGHACKDLVMML